MSWSSSGEIKYNLVVKRMTLFVLHARMSLRVTLTVLGWRILEKKVMIWKGLLYRELVCLVSFYLL